MVWFPLEQALRLTRDKEHDNYQRKFIKKCDIAGLIEALLWLYSWTENRDNRFVGISGVGGHPING
ncbi:MAG TPA: hypothetical protein DDZ89_14540 [Clostridiales bacterium]|nr:hypothetical protein [Clostridiales bacterium]